MKNLIIFFFCIVTFTLSSCTWAGKVTSKNPNNASTYKTATGILVSKKITNFDRKFGYEVMVYNTDKNNAQLREYTKVFIAKNTWERIPDPNDSTKITIEYVKDIEYGANDGLSLWDQQFNFCTGYTVE